MLTNLISALKLDQKDPAIALNYSIFLYNRSCKDDKSDENDPEMYNEAVNKIQLFEVRVKKLRDGGSGVDADPDVLMAASSLAKEMEYSLSISTPSGPEKTGTFTEIPTTFYYS